MRSEIIDFLKRELIGPNPISPYIKDGEEFLVKDSPRNRYSLGILYPQKDSTENNINTDERAADIDAKSESIATTVHPKEARSFYDNSQDDTDMTSDILTLTNAYLPSAMGISCCVSEIIKDFTISVQAARYKQDTITRIKDGNQIVESGLLRESLDTNIFLKASDILHDKQTTIVPVSKDGASTGLELQVVNRGYSNEFGTKKTILTFSLVNTNIAESSGTNDEKCFFQVSFSIETLDGSPCFLPYPKRQVVYDNETKSNALLYRNKKVFAVGHGCSPSWDDTQRNSINKITSQVIPVYEMKPIFPRQIDQVDLSMYKLAGFLGDDYLLDLENLSKGYEAWINDQLNHAEELEENYKETAVRHLNACKVCLSRIKNGINWISSDSMIKRAFNLMNQAMLAQQIHYGLPLAEWKDNGSELELQNKLPDLHTKHSWPDWSEESAKNTKYGKWYPFQIAFILMNIAATASPDDSERNIVDLIWFPTGGGKTEAYLGLSAFTIFLKRLNNITYNGTTILTRYTLRLLTAQQYQRAASLICACELIRKENEEELGTNRISLGLWAGGDLTPNSRSDAKKALNDLITNRSYKNPFLLLKCPWCGTQMGPIKVGHLIKAKGYKGTSSSVIFQCANEVCDFSKDNFPLPLTVIDEDIYASPPTMIVGTVDKFAMLVWKAPQAKAIFGFRESGRISPPSLIIQDELHLISGPLGSMVGQFETLIQELCCYEHEGRKISPKIVASTATVSHAQEQVHALYNCGQENVLIFPPPALNAGESYFAYEDVKTTGRIYLGVHASGLSHATTHVRTISALLQAVKSIEADDNSKNYYWTILDYYNSLRELGHAATRINADIPEYLSSMWNRYELLEGEKKNERRLRIHDVELTSRKDSTEITEALKNLEINYPNKEVVDICLATNMISVGVDVPRLGLMTVAGQPKSTSEYIQATSRVGRSKAGPGLVVVIYNVSKPRDRSHYEQFYSYHSTIYSHVEPTSVTPFSAPVRDRLLHAVLVGLVRFFGGTELATRPDNVIDPHIKSLVKSIIIKRVKSIDPEELEKTVELLEERFEEWERYSPPKYGDFSSDLSEDVLMYPASKDIPMNIRGKVWPTPTSMRNVDSECEAQVITEYLFNNEDN